MALEVGQIAPDFCLDCGRRNVVLAFFPLAWTPV
jgi:peroxiredoxin